MFSNDIVVLDKTWGNKHMSVLKNIILPKVVIAGALIFISGDTAIAGQNLRYATWDPPQHEWIKFGVDRWIKSVAVSYTHLTLPTILPV